MEFGHSAFKHQNNEVRKVGERLLLALYPHFPSTVRKALPLQDDLARKNVLYRNLFEQLEALDEKVRRNPKQCFRSESKLYVESRWISIFFSTFFFLLPPFFFSFSRCGYVVI